MVKKLQGTHRNKMFGTHFEWVSSTPPTLELDWVRILGDRVTHPAFSHSLSGLESYSPGEEL